MRGREGGGNEGQRGGARVARPSPSGTRPLATARGQAMRRALVLLVAGVWLALAGIALSGIAHAAPSPSSTNVVGLAALATCTPPPPCNTTPTDIATATPTATATPSVIPSATATKTPTSVPPTATTGGNGGGGGGGGGPGDVGPQPTKVVSQLPSADSGGGGGPLGGFGPGAFGSNGLLLATTSSCIVGLLGILIAAIALVVLLRGGYGPFLKALLRGKRAGDMRGKRGAKGGLAAASASTSSNRYGFGGARGAYDGRWSDPRRDREDDRPRQGSPSRSRAPSRSRSRGANRDGW